MLKVPVHFTTNDGNEKAAKQKVFKISRTMTGHVRFTSLCVFLCRPLHNVSSAYFKELKKCEALLDIVMKSALYK